MVDQIEYHVTVRCRCGLEHSFEEWQKCPMALTPRQNEAWWRVLVPVRQQRDASAITQQARNKLEAEDDHDDSDDRPDENLEGLHNDVPAFAERGTKFADDGISKFRMPMMAMTMTAKIRIDLRKSNEKHIVASGGDSLGHETNAVLSQ